MDDAPSVERRRSVGSFAAALLLHVVLLAVLALGLGVFSGAAVIPPVTVDLQISSQTGGDALAAPAGPRGRPSGGQNGSDSGGFVIPTPRAQPAEASAGAAGPAFREAGGSAGSAQSIPSVPSAVPAPSVPAVQRNSSAAVSPGAGSFSVQRSGKGVLVPGSAGSASNGSLDLSQLDRTLAGGPTGNAAGKGAASAANAGAATGRTGSQPGRGVGPALVRVRTAAGVRRGPELQRRLGRVRRRQGARARFHRFSDDSVVGERPGPHAFGHRELHAALRRRDRRRVAPAVIRLCRRRRVGHRSNPPLALHARGGRPACPRAHSLRHHAALSRGKAHRSPFSR